MGATRGNSVDSLPGVASLEEIMNTKTKLASQMIALLVPLILLAPPTFAETGPLFDPAEILDETTLDIKVLQDWHLDSRNKTTRQKLIEIKVAEWWPGQDYRIPVRLIVPLNRKASAIHITSQHRHKRLEQDAALNKTQQALTDGGVGLVYTVVQRLAAIPGGRELQREMIPRLLKTHNPRYNVTWIWPMTLMRAVTAARAERDYFEPGKVAGSGSSKNGFSPAIALIHDSRFTATFSNVAPAYISPLRTLNQAAVDEVNAANDWFFKAVEEGADPGEHTVDWYRQMAWGVSDRHMHKVALQGGWSWEDIRQISRESGARILVSENWDQLMARGVDVHFQPGTHDWVAHDVLWGAQHHPHIPVYYKPNGGHGMRLHPAARYSVAERHEGETEYFGEENLNAFLLHHFFGGESLLEPPRSSHSLVDGKLEVKVAFDTGPQPENGRIWWMYDRAPGGSAAYLRDRIPDDQWMDMTRDPQTGAWTAVIPLRPDASRIDFFSNHSQPAYGHKFYLSSPYTRVRLQ